MITDHTAAEIAQSRKDALKPAVTASGPHTPPGVKKKTSRAARTRAKAQKQPGRFA